MNPTHSSPEEIFRRLLDESSALLGAPEDAGIAIPDDELHREILLPLLPAMLGDGAIRKHWHEQAATGFPARLLRHLQSGDAAPRWQAGDFEIHVTASYSAGPDAKALADTLLSEESLRDMSAVLMNQILEVVWPKIAPAAAEVVAGGAEVPGTPVAQPAAEVVPVPELLVAAMEAPAAAPEAGRPIFRWPPLPAAILAGRRRRKPVRTGRENPISGTRTWRGKIGESDWSYGYPLAGQTAGP